MYYQDDLDHDYDEDIEDYDYGYTYSSLSDWGEEQDDYND